MIWHPLLASDWLKALPSDPSVAEDVFTKRKGKGSIFNCPPINLLMVLTSVHVPGMIPPVFNVNYSADC